MIFAWILEDWIYSLFQWFISSTFFDIPASWAFNKGNSGTARIIHLGLKLNSVFNKPYLKNDVSARISHF